MFKVSAVRDHAKLSPEQVLTVHRNPCNTKIAGIALLRLIRRTGLEGAALLRDGNGEPFITDGPFAETKEMLWP
jgi:hypothetical protein